MGYVVVALLHEERYKEGGDGVSDEVVKDYSVDYVERLKDKSIRRKELLKRCDYIFEIYKVNKEDVRDRFDSTLFDELAKELGDE